MRKVSKPVCGVALCLIVCALNAVPQLAAPADQRGAGSPREFPQSPLEAFAARPTAKVVWSKMVGHLESQEARATITALIVEDTASKPNVMRGLRIDLAHLSATPTCERKYTAWRLMCKRPNAAVYVEKGRLEAVRNRLKSGGAELRPMEFISRYWTNSSGRTSSGLIICGYQLSDRQPGELASLFTRAIGELNAVPRLTGRRVKST